MEFGIFQSATVGPKPWEGREAQRLRDDVEMGVAAEAAGFDAFWAPEHHFLEGYSHNSASHLSCLAVGMRTNRIRLCTGIMNLCPPINHPLRVAEQIATVDILTNGRVELGTGRGSGTTEINGFGVSSDESRAMWEEAIRAIPRMWADDLFEWKGTYFNVPKRSVLPKPVQKPHPPLWVTATNPTTVATGARMGLGVAVFSYGAPERLADLVDTYKTGIEHAAPVGTLVNNKIMSVTKVLCLEDSEEARTIYAQNRLDTAALIAVYMDSIPANAARFADTPRPVDQTIIRRWIDEVRTEMRRDERVIVPSADELHDDGICVGSPDEVTETIKRYQAIGLDQLVFTPRAGFAEPFETTLRSLALMGERVLPRFRSERRAQAMRS